MKIPGFWQVRQGVLLLAAGLLGASLTPNTASAMSSDDSGCVVLANVIEHSVYRVLQPRLLSGGAVTRRSEAQYELRGCATAAATTSKAFGNAMRAAGIEVAWQDHELLVPGDYCLSHYLDQCYPRPSPGIFNAANMDPARVGVAWNTVVAGIAQDMPFGVASDFAFFRPTQLVDKLVLSLQVTLDVASTDVRRSADTAPWRE